MAQQYEATPGGDGGYAAPQPPPFPAPGTAIEVMVDDGLGVVGALPVRATVVKIDSPNYPGYAARCRLNPRRSVLRDLASGDIGQVARAMSSIVLAWNFKDEQNRPLERSPEEIEDLPDDLLAPLITGYFAAFRPGDEAESAS